MVDDFLRVTIRFRDGSEQTDFHASISEIPEVSEQEETHSSPLNVMILAFDGTSAAHFERMLPKTYTYLKDNLESIMVKGYSVVGESTTPQLTALLTGRSLEENCDFSEARKEYASSTFVDVWPFIYKDLKRLGIVTMWSEDDYHIGKASLNSVAIAGKKKLAGKVFGDKVFNVFFYMTIGEIPEFLLFQEHDVFDMLLAVNVPFSSLQLIIRMSSCMVSGGFFRKVVLVFTKGKKRVG